MGNLADNRIDEVERCIEIGRDIKSQISYNLPILWSWGANDFRYLTRNEQRLGGLLFKVRGRKHKGWVQIELMPSDTYRVTFTNSKYVVKKVLNDVYCEDLVNFIDQEVET